MPYYLEGFFREHFLYISFCFVFFFKKIGMAFFKHVMAKLSALRVSNGNHEGDRSGSGSGDYFNKLDECSQRRAGNHGAHHAGGLEYDYHSSLQHHHPHQQYFQRYLATPYDTWPHPSCDIYGPVTAFSYWTRRKLLGAQHPCFAYLHLPRYSSGIKKSLLK